MLTQINNINKKIKKLIIVKNNDLKINIIKDPQKIQQQTFTYYECFNNIDSLSNYVLFNLEKQLPYKTESGLSAEPIKILYNSKSQNMIVIVDFYTIPHILLTSKSIKAPLSVYPIPNNKQKWKILDNYLYQYNETLKNIFKFHYPILCIDIDHTLLDVCKYVKKEKQSFKSKVTNKTYKIFDSISFSDIEHDILTLEDSSLKMRKYIKKSPIEYINELAKTNIFEVIILTKRKIVSELLISTISQKLYRKEIKENIYFWPFVLNVVQVESEKEKKKFVKSIKRIRWVIDDKKFLTNRECRKYEIDFIKVHPKKDEIQKVFKILET